MGGGSSIATGGGAGGGGGALDFHQKSPPISAPRRRTPAIYGVFPPDFGTADGGWDGDTINLLSRKEAGGV
jgi:hypothetical protein